MKERLRYGDKVISILIGEVHHVPGYASLWRPLRFWLALAVNWIPGQTLKKGDLEFHRAEWSMPSRNEKNRRHLIYLGPVKVSPAHSYPFSHLGKMTGWKVDGRPC